MEGPTPVSALIHAATMVTAGVFLVCRASPIFEFAPEILNSVAIIGGTTALFSATIGLVQNDIKRVIAYSTCSQLGYMFFAVGLSAYPIAMFHLFTHAFFKALLFLGAGSVIHAMSGEQDMRMMGGIARYIPQTYALMWIGSLALAGIPFFAGYYSKDLIIEASYLSNTPWGNYCFIVGLLTVFLTALYSWRLLYMVFHGKVKAHERVMAHLYESSPSMLIPMYILAGGALFSGWVGYHYFIMNPDFWGKSLYILSENDVLSAIDTIPSYIKTIPFILSLLGIATAFFIYIYRTSLAIKISEKFSFFYKLFYHKWYFDELYERIFIKPLRYVGRFLWLVGDHRIIEKLGPKFLSHLTLKSSKKTSFLQTGFIFHYAFIILCSLCVVCSYIYIKNIS